MEYLAQTSFDCSRAYWTPIMDSFFIDLMVDHMHRGNKVSHTFNKQAWVEMLTSFNEKFGSRYDKDFLKNRYATLHNQFNDIKNLLDQSGFSWDDTRNMVVADNYDWDAYIKAHPDARYYRNKVVSSFSGLCLIYAYTAADGRYSRSSHDVDFDDGAQEMNIADQTEASIPRMNNNSSRASWTPLMDGYFVDLLLKQIERGNRVSNGFVTETWNEMATLFNAKFGSRFDKKAFKNRYKDLRHQYNDLKILLNQSEVSWDESREMVTAEDYHKLSVIFRDEVSNGILTPTNDHVEPDGEDPVLLLNAYSSKEDWTPSMDQYLIHLMLEQVRRGHMIDPIFNIQSWIDIVAAFRYRFGSHYDKYLLSGQYKILRKLYNDMKNLLDVGDFSWDETRNLVTARDDVWESYIKEHPDVKSYRTKIGPSYNDLCLIFGNLNPDNRLDRLDRDIYFNGYGRNKQALHENWHKNNWDPPMDRYFIDLMLEQIHKGSMVDQRLTKQAWAEMLVKFNARFGLQLHKYDLENHFTILRKTFSDMNSLLDQNGFEWDEMQQMIIADDDMWDASTEDNYHAQLYRSRTLPNYNDLFQIYGSTSGGENHYDHFVNDNENGSGVPFGQYDNNSSAGSDIVEIDWPKKMDQFLVQLLLEVEFEGYNLDSTFDSFHWIGLTKSFNTKFGVHFDEYVMKNQYLSLVKQYKDITIILNEDGFVWDEFQQMIVADDDVWEAYIEEHPDAAMYKDKTVENYKHLRLIFGNAIEDQRSEFEPVTREEMEMDEMLEDLDYWPIEISDQSKKRQNVASLTLPSSRKTRRTNKKNEEGKVNQKAMEMIVDALETVPDMDDELFLDACNLLEDEKRAKAFVNMDIKQRRKWLLRNLRV